MFLLLNTRASGGNALKKWNRIKNSLPIFEFESCNKVDKNSNANLDISNEILKRERKFIAAGGDGTINYLLNEILTNSSKKIINEIQIGAIGLGSSNDFHKPMKLCRFINGIPCKVDFTTATERDIGCITYVQNGRETRKYFLINASIGVTAEANFVFNSSGFIIKALKSFNTNVAIIYSALHAMLFNKYFALKITDSNNTVRNLKLSNLAITKSPHISGNIKMDYPYSYANGLFNIYFLGWKRKSELIKILYQLYSNNIDTSNLFGITQSRFLNVEADKPFKIEYDGEVIETDNAKFSILPERIKICTN